MRRIALILLVWLFWSIQVRGAVPDNSVDFDRSVGFRTPRNITVYPAFGEKDLVYLVPNGIDVTSIQASTTRPRVGLAHLGTNQPADLILRMTPTIDSVPLEEVTSELKALYPNIRFAMPASLESTFVIAGAGMPEKILGHEKTGDPLAGNIVYAVRIPPLAVRGFLIGEAYKTALMAVSGEFRVRGVSRDDQGTPLITTRTVRVSTTLQGFCALNPEAVVNVNTSAFGCPRRTYPRALVLSVQRALQAEALPVGALDGVFGPRTESAIRAYQRSNRLPIDGLPSV